MIFVNITLLFFVMPLKRHMYATVTYLHIEYQDSVKVEIGIRGYKER